MMLQKVCACRDRMWDRTV